MTAYSPLSLRGDLKPKQSTSNDELENIEWREFRIGELFEIKPTKSYNMTNSTLFQTKGDVPVVTNSSLNNGVSAYVGLEPTEKGNIITYSDTTTSEGIFYQPREFVGYSHVQGLYPLDFKDKWNKYSLLYIVSAFRRASFGRFDFGNKFNRKIARELKILLPVLPTQANSTCHCEAKPKQSTQSNDENEREGYTLAFNFMQTLIKALEKESIKNVVLYQQRLKAAYEEVLKK